MYGIIYAAINTKNGKYYIGKTTTNVKKRKMAHLWRGTKITANRFHNAIHKHGPETFSWFVVDYADSKEELSNKEEQWMWATNSIHPKFGYNLRTDSLGGNKGMAHSQETKEKMRLKRLGFRFSSAECKRRSEQQKGRHPSKEAREKMSLAQKGRKHSKETIMKMSAALKGRIISKQARELLSIANKGRKQSKETLLRMSAAHKGALFSQATREKFTPFYDRVSPVICLDTGVYYDTMKLAQIATGATSISEVCKGQYKCSGGLHWRYADRSERPTPLIDKRKEPKNGATI